MNLPLPTTRNIRIGKTMNLAKIDEVFRNSFDQYVEGIFSKPDDQVLDTAIDSLRNNLGNFIDLYRSSKALEARETRLNNTIAIKNDLIRQLKKELASIRKKEKLLERQRRHLKSADQRKRHLLAHLSHEIRTPLNGVIGLSGLLGDTLLTDKQQRYVAMLKRSSHSLMQLLNDILDYSKIEAGAMVLIEEDFDLRIVLSDTISILTANAEQKQLTLTGQIEDETPLWLRGDPTRLRQILLNLVANAIKFTDEGGVRLIVDPVDRNQPDCQLRFRVIDSGIGIPENRFDRLFSAFSQLDCPAVRRQEGTGLGLAICRELTTLMGGRIGVESTVGVGSTFWFTALFSAPVSSAINTPEPIPVTDDSGSPRHLQPKILLVEDDPVNQAISRAALDKLGCAVTIAKNGQEAMSQLRAISFDLVLMDLQLPETSGLEITRWLRQPKNGARSPDVPVIALTAHHDPEERKRCRDAGMNGFLTKPLPGDALRQLLIRYLPDAIRTSIPKAANLTPSARSTLHFRKLKAMQKEIDDQFQPLVRLFLENLPEKIGRIREAYSRGDRRLLKEAAHQLRGNSANFHAERMAAICAQLEAIETIPDNDPHPLLIETLEFEARSVTRVLNDFLH